MGFFDWLFGRKKKKEAQYTAPPAAEPAPPATAAQVAADDDDEGDWSEATTFVSRRLPPAAQREIKNLRSLLGTGAQEYVWKPPADNVCAPCRKFCASGPYRVGEGLTGQAPVPGRESPHGDCRCIVVDAAGEA